ncbi:MAG: PEP-CTERM system histidine kinase PrsK [Burkholderiales bacterium]|nr:PEP-CTERM system histidine kinase PrsK [Burkholderiales bacterium]
MSTPDYLASVTYGIGAVAYAAIALQLGLRAGRSWRGRLLVAACAASSMWELTGVGHAIWSLGMTWQGYQVADALRWGLWTAFLVTLVPPAAGRKPRLPVYLALVAATSVVLFLAAFGTLNDAGTVSAFGLWIIAAIIGLALCEHVFRATPEDRRWGVKPLCIGVAALYGFDLFMFSDAALMKAVDASFWTSRGIAHVMPIPLILVASARNRAWAIDVAISRAVVFRSTALLISGVYLLAVAAAGYYVQLFGGEWGKAMTTLLLLAALLLLVVLFTSGTFRARLKVYISKNFFSYRYDYREEWLRLTAKLAQGDSRSSVYERTVRALADLVESPAGAIWMQDDDGKYRVAGSWNMAPPASEEDMSGPFIGFVARTNWIVDTRSTGTRMGEEQLPEAPAWLTAIPDAWLLVPMASETRLVGFVVLLKPRVPVEVNWEVLDLLKTAARQAASYLGHVRAIEALVEAKQFDAFNRMSAFVVHDLKNLIAQLSLMLRNAERHGSNPEFQRDMLETVQHVVERMNRLLLQLRSGETPVENPRPVELAPLIERVRLVHTRQGHPVRATVEPGLRALGHEERLERVIGHLVQNAVDASEAHSPVDIRASLGTDRRAVIEVSDLGKGMSSEFIRDQLFKPFRTTKAAGMGIGAFESHQYIRELGGNITVESMPGEGTRFTVSLPGFNKENDIQAQQVAA